MEDLPVSQRRQFYEATKDSIVCVQRADGFFGGGVFVQVGSEQLVLTAAHFVYGNGGANLKVIFADKKFFTARRVYVKRDFDVALLKATGKIESNIKCLNLYKGKLIRGAEIHFIGHPGMQKFSYNIGRISCVDRKCGDIYTREMMLVNAPPFPSSDYPDTIATKLIDDFRGLAPSLRFVSGKNVHGGGRVGGTGAPFLSGKGEIVGLYSFTYRDEDYAIHVDEIEKVFDMFKAEKDGERTTTSRGPRMMTRTSAFASAGKRMMLRGSSSAKSAKLRMGKKH